MPENIGHVIQIAGPAVDVQFAEHKLPPIYSALRVVGDGFTTPFPINVILEVEQQLGEGRVRCVAMEPTDGMVRGMKAIDLGGPITVPVGKGDPGPRAQRHWRAGGQAGSGERRKAPAYPSCRSLRSTSSPLRRRCSKPA